jgi:hypothetical protein
VREGCNNRLETMTARFVQARWGSGVVGDLFGTVVRTQHPAAREKPRVRQNRRLQSIRCFCCSGIQAVLQMVLRTSNDVWPCIPATSEVFYMKIQVSCH